MVTNSMHVAFVVFPSTVQIDVNIITIAITVITTACSDGKQRIEACLRQATAAAALCRAQKR